MRRILFSIGSLNIYGYGLMIAAGIILAFMLSERIAAKRGLDNDALFNMGVAGVIAGLIGAKLLYLIIELPAIIADPSLLLNINEGFVVYGGLITGILAGWLYAKKKKLPIWGYLDCGVAGVALGQGFGRLGCFLAGCCYGKHTDLACGVVFPQGSMAPAGVRLIPTQLISAAGDFLLVILLIVIGGRTVTGLAGKTRNTSAEGKAGRDSASGGLTGENSAAGGKTGRAVKALPDGSAVCAYLIFYAVGRFLVEFLRADERGSVGPLSTSQFIACIMAAAGLALAWVIAGRKKEGRRLS